MRPERFTLVCVLKITCFVKINERNELKTIRREEENECVVFGDRNLEADDFDFLENIVQTFWRIHVIFTLFALKYARDVRETCARNGCNSCG